MWYNMFKVYNKGTRSTFMTRFWFFFIWISFYGTFTQFQKFNPISIYLPKVNNRNSTKKKLQNMFKFNNKITRTTSRHWRRSGVFIVNSEHISHSFVFLLLTLNKYIIAGQASSHTCSNLPSKPLETLKMELLAKTVNGLWCLSGFCHSQKLSNFRKISGIFTIHKNKTVPSRKIHAQIQKQKH